MTQLLGGPHFNQRNRGSVGLDCTKNHSTYLEWAQNPHCRSHTGTINPSPPRSPVLRRSKSRGFPPSECPVPAVLRLPDHPATGTRSSRRQLRARSDTPRTGRAPVFGTRLPDGDRQSVRFTDPDRRPPHPSRGHGVFGARSLISTAAGFIWWGQVISQRTCLRTISEHVESSPAGAVP